MLATVLMTILILEWCADLGFGSEDVVDVGVDSGIDLYHDLPSILSISRLILILASALIWALLIKYRHLFRYWPDRSWFW